MRERRKMRDPLPFGVKRKKIRDANSILSLSFVVLRKNVGKGGDIRYLVSLLILCDQFFIEKAPHLISMPTLFEPSITFQT